MVKFKIEIKKSAAKEIKSIPKKDLKFIFNGISSLAENPYPTNSSKLTADEKCRLRIGKYRILYQVFRSIITIVVVKVGHRKDIYKKIK